MENGGKRKRIGLSLKSFKKPASNYVKKQQVGQRFAEVSSNKGKPNSCLDKVNLTRQTQIIEAPISENRMKLLSLMPKFPAWKSMDPFPLNYWIKSLNESKSEMNDKNTESHYSNGNTTKKVKNKNYTDLPKHGFHYLFHKIKTQPMPSYESDQSYTKAGTVTPEVNSNEIIKQDFNHDRSESENFNSLHKRGNFKVDINLNHIDDNEIKLSNVCPTHDQTLVKASQNKLAVKIDLTDDVDDNFKFNLENSRGNGERSSNKANVAAGSQDNRLPNLDKNKSIGACISGVKSSVNMKSSSNEESSSVNTKSAKIKDKTSIGHEQTICQWKMVENKNMKQHELGCATSTNEKPHTNSSKANFGNTVYDETNIVIPNTPPRGHRKIMKSRPTVHKRSHLQADRATGSFARQDLSFSKTKGSNQHDDTMKSSGRTVNEMNNNRRMSGHNDSEPHVDANDLFEKPIFPNMSKVNRLGNTSRQDQQLFAQNNLKKSYVRKGNSTYYSDLQTRVPARETSFSDSKVILKAKTFDNTTRSSQDRQTLEKTAQTNKSDPKQSSFSTIDGKQTYLQSSKQTFGHKNISKTQPIAGTTNDPRTYDGDYGPPKGMECGLGSDEDLFGFDDGLDELLAKSFTEDLDYNNHLGTRRENNNLKLMQNNVNNDDSGIKDFLGYLDNDMDDDTLVACCDEVLSPTISVRKKGPNSGLARSSRNYGPLKGVKRKLNIPDAQSKFRRPNINNSVGYSRGLDKDGNDEKITKCPFCAKSFHSGLSKGDINQHIVMCCSTEDIGNDDALLW